MNGVLEESTIWFGDTLSNPTTRNLGSSLNVKKCLSELCAELGEGLNWEAKTVPQGKPEVDPVNLLTLVPGQRFCQIFLPSCLPDLRNHNCL